jgi:hypothetical protein
MKRCMGVGPLSSIGVAIRARLLGCHQLELLRYS